MKKKKIKSNFIVKCGIFPYEIMVSVDQTDEELKKVLSKYSDNVEEDYVSSFNMPETSRGRMIMNDNNHCIIRLNSQPTKDRMINLVSHEIFHAVTYIMDRIGMKLKLRTSCEAYAYLTGYITEQIFKELEL